MARTPHRRQIADLSRRPPGLDCLWRTGLKQSGNGHGGAHSLRQAAVFENDFFAADQIRRHATIGNRQIIKGFQICIRQRFAIDKQADLMSRVQSGGERESLFQAKLNKRRIVAIVFLAAKGQILVGSLAADDDVPVLLLDQFPEVLWEICRWRTVRDQSAHAGAGQCNRWM